MNNVSRFVTFFYGLAFVVAGFVNYINSDRVEYAIWGTATALLLLASLEALKSKPNRWYLYMATVSLILSSLFLNKFAHNHDVALTGGLFFASFVTFVIISLSWFENKRKTHKEE